MITKLNEWCKKQKEEKKYWYTNYTGQNENYALCHLFCTQNEENSHFGLTFGHKRSCDSVMGHPIFANLVSKYP